MESPLLMAIAAELYAFFDALVPVVRREDSTTFEGRVFICVRAGAFLLPLNN